MTEENRFLNSLGDLSKLCKTCWNDLASALGNSDHPWFLSSFATCDEYIPHVRLLVLRDVDADENSIVFHTDSRSEKISQVRNHPTTSALFWNPDDRVQLILHGESNVQTTGKIVDEQWSLCALTSRRAYLGELPPGEPADEMCVNFPEELASRPPSPEETESGRENFAVIAMSVISMDVLLLRQQGNVRARFDWKAKDNLNGRWHGQWVAP